MKKPEILLDNYLTLLPQLFRHINQRRRYQFILLLGLTLVSSVAEVISLGAIVPFIGILTQPESVFNHPLMADPIQVLGIVSAQDLILPLTVVFAVAALVAGGIRMLLLWVSTRLASVTGAELGVEVYYRTLHQPYSVHVARSSSEIISGVTQKVSSATSVLLAVVNIITSMALFVAIFTTLLVIDPMVAIVAMISFGASYGIIAWKTRQRLMQNGRQIAKKQTQLVKALQEGLGAIRDVLLDSSHAVYVGIYRRGVQKLVRAGMENTYINQSPRFVMETLGIILIAVLAYILSNQSGGVGSALPILGALALGAQRLLPLLQRIYGSWSAMTGSKAALVDVINLLDQPLPEDVHQQVPAPLKLQNSIQFDNVYFRYSSEGPWVLEGINLIIPKGARVGFAGSTGSGKSTALDLLMFLLEPTKGFIRVDGQPINSQRRRAWQSSIAHVPQSIFLADSSIAENIAFGVPPDQIDLGRVREAADQAQIAEFIEGLAEGYDVMVGEQGIRLSGGQRQRVGIARALYKRATVIIFDEATSALDSETEKEVMAAIENLNRDLTVLIIAHRLTTLRNCDTIVKLEQGQMTSQGSYKDFINIDSNPQKIGKTEVDS